MKTKMIAIASILTIMMASMGGTAWAKNDRGQRQRQEVRNHENHGQQAQQRHENWGRRAPKYYANQHSQQFRGPHRPPAPVVRHHNSRPYHQPRPVYVPRHHHHNSGFLFGWSIYQPGLGFSIVLGDRH